MSAPLVCKCHGGRVGGGGSLIWRNRMSPLRIIKQNVELSSQCSLSLSPILLLVFFVVYIYTSPHPTQAPSHAGARLA